jgi:hypothetical protein
LLPDWLYCGVVCDCTITKYILLNNTRGMNHLKITTFLNIHFYIPHTHSGLPSRNFPSEFRTKILYTVLISICLLHVPHWRLLSHYM